MLRYPRDADPSGDHDNPIRAGIIVPFILCSIFFFARVYTRIFIIEIWGWDDSWISIAWIANLATVTLWCVELYYGEATSLGAILQFAGTLTYEVGIFGTQISILFFYLRLLPGGKIQFLTKVSIAVIILISIPSLFATLFICNSRTGLFPYNPSIACVPPEPLLFAGTAFVTLADVWLMIIIIPVLVKLQLPWKQKIALLSIMSGGLIVVIASIIRVVLLVNEQKKPSQEFNPGSFLVCSAIQLSLGIVCATAPATVPLLRKLQPWRKANLNGSRPLNSYGGRTTRTRIQDMKDAIELNYVHDQSIIKSNVHYNRSRSQPKRGWFSSQHGDNESQEGVLPPNGSTAGIIKTSDKVFTETTMESEGV